LNSKGQFSIIAALLVAVILISTVIVTYSTIRNSPIPNQPQVLSAIDETNFAIKQIFGFTVGYYGSVLKVTGNSSYAKTLALNYLYSGLVNIANMHPEWGTSFNVNKSKTELHICWFTKTSYSTGNLAVTYNLTGLGIYRITYQTSCKLSIQIIKTNSTTQACLNVTKDEKNEPLINLGKQNFKFYCYKSAKSAWELINPSTEPIAFANGTYLIDIPSGIDPYAYVIQVEDSRGIIVSASSFSRYTCTLAWNSTLYAATGAINRTLINQESFEGSSFPPSQPSSWSSTGTWHRGNSRAHSGSYSAEFDGSFFFGGSGDLTTCDLNCIDSPSAIYVDFWYRDEGCEANEFLLRYYNGTAWNTISDLGLTGPDNTWLHYQQRVTDSRYFKSTFKIRWSAVGLDSSEHVYVDDVTVKKEVSTSVQDATIVAELLQNGTIRWLGQNLQLTTQAKPIPPIPVKAIHVNQTVTGSNREVPFQIEDWASDYKIPLGLTSNASVFSSTTMLVFLVNSKVSKVTIWWDGSDTAIQTSYAYINKYFTVDTVQRTLTNGILNLKIDFSSRSGVNSFKVISTIGTSTSSTAEFMRINNKVADYGNSEPVYAVTSGTVRAVIHHEVEWDGGITNPLCPNVYAHIVLTLPANATYYTYQLRLMFVNSQQDRTITDLCPIKLMTSTGQQQTENGTLSGYPIVSSSIGTFYNFSTSTWAHHWSQYISGTKGTGIMFTDDANKMLYVFDRIAGSKTGAVRVNSDRSIELLPVIRFQVQFKYALDVTWYGAVATFDATTPIYEVVSGKQTGLWIIAERPPTITVTTQS
jgi:hypothetical protein